MKSTAVTPEQYLASLPDDRRAAISTVRDFLLQHLDPAFQECMLYGVLAYTIPHTLWPHGHHTNPKLPLMYMGLSSQKNDMVVYMLMLLHNKPEREWFDKAWKATGKKSYLEVSGAGCCLRFKKVEDLSLDVIGEAMRRMSVAKYLEDHAAMLERVGKGVGGKASKNKARVGTNTKSPPARKHAKGKKVPAKRR